jgi:L-asparaginase
MPSKIRIAHLAGPNATIQNTPPLVTSNKARKKFGLPLLKDIEGQPSAFDVLRPQKLAAPVTVRWQSSARGPIAGGAAWLGQRPCNLDFHRQRRTSAQHLISVRNRS